MSILLQTLNNCKRLPDALSRNLGKSYELPIEITLSWRIFFSSDWIFQMSTKAKCILLINLRNPIFGKLGSTLVGDASTFRVNWWRQKSTRDQLFFQFVQNIRLFSLFTWTQALEIEYFSNLYKIIGSFHFLLEHNSFCFNFKSILFE